MLGEEKEVTLVHHGICIWLCLVFYDAYQRYF